MFAAVIIVLSLVIVTQQIMHYKEREKFLNRIMAKDLPEYQAIERKSVQKGGNFLKNSIEKVSNKGL